MTDKRPNLGFLTALEDEQGGFLGGYLATNHLGRPLEFQCTKPVRPNTSQRILYGETLRPYVMGELIGRTLFEKTAVKPDLLFTDQKAVLALREHLDCPLVLLDSAQKPDDNDRAQAASPGLEAGEGISREDPRTSWLVCHVGFEGDRSKVESWLQGSECSVDLQEPFSRIREAIDEAVQTSTLR